MFVTDAVGGRSQRRTARRSKRLDTQAPSRIPRSRPLSRRSATGRHRWPPRRARSSPGLFRGNPESDHRRGRLRWRETALAGCSSAQPGGCPRRDALRGERRSLQRQARRNGCPRVRSTPSWSASPAPPDVTFAADTVGGISGWWGKPAPPATGRGGSFTSRRLVQLGTASAYRHFVGHIASSAGADAFVPSIGSLPSIPFLLRLRTSRHAIAVWLTRGSPKIAVTGDSAAGDLALVLLSIACAQARQGWRCSVGAVAISR